MINPVLPKNHGMNQIEIVSCNGICDTSSGECPYCSSKYLMKKGKRRLCKNCGKSFVLPSLRQRQTFPPKDQRFAGIKSWSEDDCKAVSWKRDMPHSDNVVVRRGGD